MPPESADPDLDSILDSALADFDAPLSTPSTPPRPSSPAPSPSTPPAAGADPTPEAAFAEALASLGALGADTDATAEPNTEDMALVDEFLTSLTTQFEAMGLPSDGGAAPPPAGPGGRAARVAADSGIRNEGDIDKLTRELEALLASGGVADADHGGGGSGGSGSGSGSGSGDAPPGGGNFEKVVQSVVGELLSEDVLRSPMEQMHAAFGDWLPANRAALPDGDVARYEKQADIVGQICAEYKRAGTDTARVMALLHEMQETGAPPPAVMEKLGDDGIGAGGLGESGTAGGDGTEACPVQ